MRIKLYFCIICLLLGTYELAKAQRTSTIKVSGGRSSSNFTADIPDAGSDISSVYTTSSALINLSITSSGDYRISAQQADDNWDSRLSFYIRRTGSGTGTTGGYIFGGASFFPLSPFSQTFFEGRFTRRNVPIQYEFRNLSVLIPAGGQTSSVIYTITSL